MPVIARQLGSLISEALQSRISTASVGLFGPSTSAAVATTQAPVVPTQISSVPPVTSIINTLTQSVVPSTTAVLPTTTIVPTTTLITTSTPLTTSTPVVTPTSTPVASTVPQLTLTTPDVSSPVNTVPTSTRTSTSSTGTPTGAASNAGASQQSNMSTGIIALIVVGAVLAVLLAGAFAFRRIQVYRRAKRRENNYGAGAIPDAPFPFTNVSESDMKGAQPVRDFGRQPSVSSYHTEKPLPSLVPDLYPVDLNANAYGQPAYNDGMSGPYPMMGAAAYGYGQNRTASPAPSQPQRMMSPAPVSTFARAPSPVNPYQKHPQMLTPAAPPAAATLAVPGASLSVPQVSGKKRVIQTFQPSLPDELDIRDGDWVVVVHAYDDGWGLCECNGRRGVVPLECLDLGRPDFRASRRLSSLSAIRQ